MTGRPAMRFSGPVLGSPDPVALARFYERLLGWPIRDVEGDGPDDDRDGWAILYSEKQRVKIEIQYEPHFAPPVWPPVAGEQQLLSHLDIAVDDLEAGVRWAVDAGARLADHQPQDDVRVMLDPHGHVFCLFPDDPANAIARQE